MNFDWLTWYSHVLHWFLLHWFFITLVLITLPTRRREKGLIFEVVRIYRKLPCGVIDLPEKHFVKYVKNHTIDL